MKKSRPVRSLQRLVGGNSFLLASGSIETRPLKNKLARTSMLLILTFAESSNVSEPIFAHEQGGFSCRGGGPALKPLIVNGAECEIAVGNHVC